MDFYAKPKLLSSQPSGGSAGGPPRASKEVGLAVGKVAVWCRKLSILRGLPFVSSKIFRKALASQALENFGVSEACSKGVIQTFYFQTRALAEKICGK